MRFNQDHGHRLPNNLVKIIKTSSLSLTRKMSILDQDFAPVHNLNNKLSRFSLLELTD